MTNITINSILLFSLFFLFSSQAASAKFTKLHFYVQDLLEGPNATVWEVAASDRTPNSSTYFGLTRVIDNLVTILPDYHSDKVGRAQGFIAFTDLQEMGCTVNINFYLTDGKFSGSTVTIVGRIPLAGDQKKEIPIVGGTGAFRMARGYAYLQTYSFDHSIGYGVLEYTLYIYRNVREDLDSVV